MYQTPIYQLMNPLRILGLFAITCFFIALSSATQASQYDAELLQLTNTERQNAGLPALTLSSQLGQAAQNHAEDMATNNYFSHDGLNGSQPWDRAKAAGYNYSYVGENIYAGLSTATAVIKGWMNSQGHRENILNPNYTEIGFGYAYNQSSDYRHYWVQVFGKAMGGSIPTVQDVQDSLTWQTSKANAISLAQRDGKLILLVAGRDTCGNTNHTRDTLVKTTSPPINTLLQERFVLWYANVDSSSEYSAYSQGLGSYTLPLIATIDPNDSDNYLDRTTNVQEPNAFYARLEQLTQAPLAKFTVSQQQGQVPLSITLDASDSLDRDGSIVDYRWTFGDGQGTNGPIVSAQHTFVTAGTYSVTLIVTDNAGLTHRAFKTITVTDQNHQNQVDDTVNDSSAGGCTLGKGDATFDPLFPFMLIMSLWYWYRRRSSVIK